jgi:serine/threonine-protein kinase
LGVSLSPGTRLGPYEIAGAIGAGGMGEVYRARDGRLGRDVAIKVLPPAFAQDAERVARFRREAQILASLNHPNIAAIHGLEEGEGTIALAMEYVGGEDLAQRLRRGAIPVEESIAIAGQIAEALEEAHEHGIVHRDLKPANVKLTSEGKVKVLDFGLAKALEGDASGGNGTGSGDLSHSPTMAHEGTGAGLILGTAAYMSPEQARGRRVDKRADIWAFGALVFEMLTGKRLFEGETVSDTLAAVLRQDVGWSALPEATPSSVRTLLRRCLERDVKRRLRDIGEARLTLAEPGAFPAAATPGVVSAPAKPAFATAATLALVAAASAAAGVLAWTRSQPPLSRPVTRLSIPLPPGHVLTGNGAPAITRDGRLIAYAARDPSGASRLYLRPLDRFESIAVPESDGGQQPFFSPDGSRVGFFARGKLLTASVAGGAPTPIADSSAHPLGATWGEDDAIVFAPVLSSGLVRVPSSGGALQQLTTPDEGTGGYAHGRPQLLPGGKSVLFTIWGGANATDRGPALLSLEKKTWTHVAGGIWSARYVRSGHLLLSGPRGVRATPFDPDDAQVVNPQTFVIEQVFSTIAWSDSWFAVSDTGTLLYVPADFLLGTLTWVDREGRMTPASDKPVSLTDPTLNPDSERVAFADRDDKLWSVDLRRGTPTPLTEDGQGSNAYPVWSRDGARLTFASNRTGDWEIYSVPAAGGPEKRLLERKGNQFPSSYAPDGTLLFIERSKGRNGADLLTLAPDGTVTPLLVSQPASKVGGQFSPDGNAIAYASDESGRDEIYVRQFGRSGDAGPAVPVSSDGGSAPRWSPDGREIFYRRGDAFLAASVSQAAGKLSVGDSRRVFEVRAAHGRSTLQPGYSLSPDGRRFLIHLLDPRALPTRIDVVLDWFEELKTRVPAR